MAKLYGDGINSDYEAIQEMLDSGTCEVYLPAPEKAYVIDKTLIIHSNQTLRLGRTTTIRLKDGSNCAMIETDFSVLTENACIEGGIWDFNSQGQLGNPYHFPYGPDNKTNVERMREEGWGYADLKAPHERYSGMAMRFSGVKNFVVQSLTIKNPVTYGIQIYKAENFTFRDLIFDYQIGSPKKWNMDGIHVEGYCKNGTIENLQGECHDDTVAITSDDCLYGPVENITVNGIKAYGAHSAVRLLSHGIPLKNIHISNIYGTYYVYCVGLTHYHGDNGRGVMENITIDNVYAGNCPGTADVCGGNFPFIWLEKNIDAKNLTIENIVREEEFSKKPMIKFDENTTVKGFTLKNICQVNKTGDEVPMLVLEGEITDETRENIREY